MGVPSSAQMGGKLRSTTGVSGVRLRPPLTGGVSALPGHAWQHVSTAAEAAAAAAAAAVAAAAAAAVVLRLRVLGGKLRAGIVTFYSSGSFRKMRLMNNSSKLLGFSFFACLIFSSAKPSKGNFRRYHPVYNRLLPRTKKMMICQSMNFLVLLVKCSNLGWKHKMCLV